MFASLVSLALAFPLTIAQDLSVPSTWRVSDLSWLSVEILLKFPCTHWQDPNTSLSFSKRVSIAQDCINTLTAVLDTSTGSFHGKHHTRLCTHLLFMSALSSLSSGLGYWQNANVLSAMANLDYFTTSRTNQKATTESLNAAFSLYTNYDQYGCV